MNKDSKPGVKKPVIVGKLSDAKDRGVAGVVACAGCASTKGTLEGTAFRCETPQCRFYKGSVGMRPVPPSPWSRGTK